MEDAHVRCSKSTPPGYLPEPLPEASARLHASFHARSPPRPTKHPDSMRLCRHSTGPAEVRAQKGCGSRKYAHNKGSSNG
jgi:hypothetical protein